MTWPIGIATGCCLETPILDILPMLERTGYAGVEISTPPRHFDVNSAEQVDALTAYFARSPLTPVSMHAPFGRSLELSALDRTLRETAVAAIVRTAECVQRVGGRMLVVHISDLERHGRPVQAHLACGAESVAVIAARCRAIGITLVVESPLPHLIGGHPAEFASLLELLDSDIAVCLDTGHVSLGHHWREFVAVAEGRLAHVHVTDNHGHFDDHLPPGDGVLDWGMIRRSLQEARFRGWLILELAAPHPAAPFFVRALEQAHRLFTC